MIMIKRSTKKLGERSNQVVTDQPLWKQGKNLRVNYSRKSERGEDSLDDMIEDESCTGPPVSAR